MQTGAPGNNCWQESYQILSRWKSFNSKEVMSHSEWGEKFPPFKEGLRCKQEHLATTVETLLVHVKLNFNFCTHTSSRKVN